AVAKHEAGRVVVVVHGGFLAGLHCGAGAIWRAGARRTGDWATEAPVVARHNGHDDPGERHGITRRDGRPWQGLLHLRVRLLEGRDGRRVLRGRAVIVDMAHGQAPDQLDEVAVA